MAELRRLGPGSWWAYGALEEIGYDEYLTLKGLALMPARGGVVCRWRRG